MIEQEMAEISAELVSLADISHDDEVVVITDVEKIEVGKSLNAAARSIGASSNLILKPRMEAHGDELSPSVAGAMKEATVIVDANTHAITHTEARREASEAGASFVSLRGVTPQMMIDGTINTDYSEVRKLTNAVAIIQSEASSGRATCDNGTDIWVNLEGRECLHKDYEVGRMDSSGIMMVPDGKCGITPVEGESEGEIVIDYSMDNLGKLTTPISLTVEEGIVTSIEGGREANKLRRIVESAGEGARNLAEGISVGTNPHLEFTGNQTIDKKVLGCANFALGDNRTLGGSVRSDIHLDGVVSQPTIEFDGEKIVDDGQFLSEKAFELAGVNG